MTSNDDDDSFNASRAEVFEALGHPTRIRILQVLAEKPLGFAELKRAAGIESNGLLTFHLGKLSGLVKVNSDGAYALTDEGREALHTIEASRSQRQGEKPRSRFAIPRSRSKVAIAIVLAVLIAGAGFYAYSTYASPGTRCQFVPGDNIYIRLSASNSGEPLTGLGVKGWLYELCPIASSGSVPATPKSTVLGNWNFLTNSTGYVSIPSSELAGWSFTFNVPYEGQIYQFSAPVCGGGTTTVQVELPSGTLNGTTTGHGTSVSYAADGTQIIQACAVGGFSANATVVP